MIKQGLNVTICLERLLDKKHEIQLQDVTTIFTCINDNIKNNTRHMNDPADCFTIIDNIVANITGQATPSGTSQPVPPQVPDLIQMPPLPIASVLEMQELLMLQQRQRMQQLLMLQQQQQMQQQQMQQQQMPDFASRQGKRPSAHDDLPGSKRKRLI